MAGGDAGAQRLECAVLVQSRPARAVSRFGSDTAYWKESAKMLAAAIHFMRGTPYIYQGEELGMTNAHFTSIDQYRDVESLNYYNILRGEGKSEAETLDIIAQRSRDNGRTPMQWDASANAGFTTGTPWIGTADNYQAINAAAEMDDPDSVRSSTRRWCTCANSTRSSARGKSSSSSRKMPTCWPTAAMVRRTEKSCWCCAT